ncbi:uncharacterized protein LOC106883869 isoform X2 [Octopus bimaculoides]|uniref:uncharacterized protein LOC106883869 isoform X2 n=1 Tax=Octopus bimaculoides TaxID=37653 RepID=UPI00071CA35F|nr:uncharacterized protein LOC106883869 isoform X2 [Octopus bimaculoides]|eukprot:XP_014790492.1 PREDICTED: uncharacterized protein LOC106883869 isoform X2 [Octopus bimaculoides]
MQLLAFCDKISSESVTKDVPRKDVPTNDAPTHDAPTDDAPDSQVLAEDIDNASFKCKEYFEHNPMTFYDIETEMEKYRALQPTPVHN